VAKEPMWGGVFGEGQCSPSARRSGGELSLPLPPKKFHRICTNPVAMPVDGRGRMPPCAPCGYATDCVLLFSVVSLKCQNCQHCSISNLLLTCRRKRLDCSLRQEEGESVKVVPAELVQHLRWVNGRQQCHCYYYSQQHFKPWSMVTMCDRSHHTHGLRHADLDT